MSTSPPNIIQMGTVSTPNGTMPIMVDVGTNTIGGGAGAVRVQMAANCTYTLLAPDGIATPPFLTGSAVAYRPGLQYGPGAILDLYEPDAAALIALGAATFVANL